MTAISPRFGPKFSHILRHRATDSSSAGGPISRDLAYMILNTVGTEQSGFSTRWVYLGSAHILNTVGTEQSGFSTRWVYLGSAHVAVLRHEATSGSAGWSHLEYRQRN